MISMQKVSCCDLNVKREKGGVTNRWILKNNQNILNVKTGNVFFVGKGKITKILLLMLVCEYWLKSGYRCIVCQILVWHLFIVILYIIPTVMRTYIYCRVIISYSLFLSFTEDTKQYLRRSFIVRIGHINAWGKSIRV